MIHGAHPLARWRTLSALWLLTLGHSGLAEGRFTLREGEVVAFVGGQNMVEWQENGYVELLLTLRFAQERPIFRNLAWEGDTVYSQPREVNFPSIPALLERVRATVVFLQFGQSESLEGPEALPGFLAAYERLIGTLPGDGRRLVLVSPTPFGGADWPWPDLTLRNPLLANYVKAIESLAAQRHLEFVDLFTPLVADSRAGATLTRNGLHLSETGHWRAACELARQLGFPPPDELKRNLANGVLRDPDLESLRQLLVHKNRLWFHYWRPMNWAFLAGDRTEQPSSRDHRDPSVRWFPRELDEFLPLIRKAETEIHTQAVERIGSIAWLTLPHE